MLPSSGRESENAIKKIGCFVRQRCHTVTPRARMQKQLRTVRLQSVKNRTMIGRQMAEKRLPESRRSSNSAVSINIIIAFPIGVATVSVDGGGCLPACVPSPRRPS